MDTWKKFAAIFTILIVVVVIITLAAVNYQGLGTALTQWTGPFTNGLFNAGHSITTWMGASGYNMLLSGVGVIFLCVLSALAYWHWDVGYKLRPSTNPNTGSPGGFQQNTSQTIPVTGLQSTTTPTAPAENPFKEPVKPKAE